MDRDERLYRMFGRFFPQGTILFNENDPAEEMFYVQSGRLGVTDPVGGKEAAETREVGPGDLLGEDSFTGGGQRRAMAEVLEDSRLLVIDPGNVDSVVRNGPELAEALMEKLLASLSSSWERLYSWQCAHAWKRVSEHLKSTEKGRSWEAGEISSEIGVEEFTVRMILAKMAAAGAVRAEGGSYALADSAVLERISPVECDPPEEGRWQR